LRIPYHKSPFSKSMLHQPVLLHSISLRFITVLLSSLVLYFFPVMRY